MAADCEYYYGDYDLPHIGDYSARASNTSPTDKSDGLPLSGVRVLELGQLIAGPFAGQLLGCVRTLSLCICTDGETEIFGWARHFGAEIIKVEPPKSGDPLRVWREVDVDGTSPWFRSIGRNKKSVTIDMRKEEGRACVCSQSLSDVKFTKKNQKTKQRLTANS